MKVSKEVLPLGGSLNYLAVRPTGAPGSENELEQHQSEKENR
jgi:hypothetical protein